ncbi:MAG: hypothetical protein JNL18_18430 [Planctomycetaceae bacterium]|nr:hypothetical protein [Planctomycetaceae bacterium]
MARHFFGWSFAIVAPWLLQVAANSPVAMGQEFRIETEVYVGEEPEPVSHTVTLFEKAAVYEFMDNPQQIIVYRQGQEGKSGQFILLDTVRERRTDVEVDRVEKLMHKMTDWAAEHKDPLLKFAAKPTFEESFDAETGSLTLANKEWTYRAATIKAEDTAKLNRYREFTDRYAELSAMMFNSPPPGPRLALDAAFARHGVVPVEIKRTLGGDEKNVVKATHMFYWQLSREDRRRLDEAQAHLANFKKVDNEQFIAAKTGKDVVRGQSK